LVPSTTSAVFSAIGLAGSMSATSCAFSSSAVGAAAAAAADVVALEAAEALDVAATEVVVADESELSSELHAPRARTAATAQALTRVLRMITA
jgi:hypothetical protein